MSDVSRPVSRPRRARERHASSCASGEQRPVPSRSEPGERDEVTGEAACAIVVDYGEGDMNAAHLHLMFNHVPVMGVVFVVLLLLRANYRQSLELIRFALVTFVG